MTNNETFQTILHLTGLAKDRYLLIEIFRLGGIKTTKSKIKGWRTSINNNRAYEMSDNTLKAFFQGLFVYRDIQIDKGHSVFNFINH